MAIFNKSPEEKEEKQQKEIEKFMERYQLEDLDEKDLVVLKKIANDLAGSDLMKVGVKLTFGTKPEENLKISYLNTLVQQNWIIIRQLSRLNKNLEEKWNNTYKEVKLWN